MHLTEERHKHRGLSGSRRANDQVELARLEYNLVVGTQTETFPGRRSTIIWVIRPCKMCSTESYLVSVFREIERNLMGRLLGERIQKFRLKQL